MATQEGSKHKASTKRKQAAKITDEKAMVHVKAAQNQAKAEEQTGLKSEELLTEAPQNLATAHEEVEQEQQVTVKAEQALTEAKEALAAAQVAVEQERQARAETALTLAETQETLAAAQAEMEQERQARIKAEQARVEAESALEEANKAMEVAMKNRELLLLEPGEEDAGQRISFIVRLMVDERGQPQRTEVKHAQSGKKETFLALDVQRLAAFMKTCLSRPASLEPAAPLMLPPRRVETPRKESAKPVADLTISEVRVYHIGAPSGTALVFNPNEAFVIQPCFQLQGAMATSLTTQESSYEVNVYAYDMTCGASKLLTSHKANLVKEVLGYAVPLQAPGLSPGLFRLMTVVTLQAPDKTMSYHEGPVIQVTGTGQPTPELLVRGA